MARPKGFEREEVLDRAVTVFWEKGFEAASIQDLVDAMGIQRGSLYAAFGSKQEMFLAALDRYGEVVVEQLLQSLQQGPSPVAAVQGFFEKLIGQIVGEGPWRGCLLTNSAVELGLRDPKTRAKVRRWLERIEAAFRETLEGARAEGELHQDCNTQNLAAFLVTLLQGLLVTGRIRPQREYLAGIVETALITLEQADNHRARVP